METYQMINALRLLSEKHKNDVVFTGEPNWSNVCRDCADKLEELSKQVYIYEYDPANETFSQLKTAVENLRLATKTTVVALPKPGCAHKMDRAAVIVYLQQAIDKLKQDVY